MRRAEIVTVRATLPTGETVEMEAQGLIARAWQHELDHLDGTLFVDRLSPTAKLIIEPKLQEMAERQTDGASTSDDQRLRSTTRTPRRQESAQSGKKFLACRSWRLGALVVNDPG